MNDKDRMIARALIVRYLNATIGLRITKEWWGQDIRMNISTVSVR